MAVVGGEPRRDIITLTGLLTSSFRRKRSSCAEAGNASVLGRGVQLH